MEEATAGLESCFFPIVTPNLENKKALVSSIRELYRDLFFPVGSLYISHVDPEGFMGGKWEKQSFIGTKQSTNRYPLVYGGKSNDAPEGYVYCYKRIS